MDQILEGKPLQEVDHLFLLAAGERIMERQPDELVTDTPVTVTRFSLNSPMSERCNGKITTL
jgi:hypothetical protein